MGRVIPLGGLYMSRTWYRTPQTPVTRQDRRMLESSRGWIGGKSDLEFADSRAEERRRNFGTKEGSRILRISTRSHRQWWKESSGLFDNRHFLFYIRNIPH